MKQLIAFVRGRFARISKLMRMTSEPEAKKLKLQDDGAGEGRKPFPYRKRKMALLMMFCGKDYYGFQKNKGFSTIEGSLMDALLKAGVISPDHYDHPRDKMGFQRASRTDKGVSCVGQVVSLKMFIDVENAVHKINDALPPEIRVLEAIQTTKGFDAKLRADARSYSYMTPTLAFTPHKEDVKEDFRVTDETLATITETLNMFKGTRNFYNYTSGRAVTDHSCKRYIMEFKIGEPFIKEGMEFIVFHIKGQSFMLHQIRKMIGMTIAIVQGSVSKDYLELTWGPERVDVPKAPGVGLMLEEVHYSFYNGKYGQDGVHKPIAFSVHSDKIELFKQQRIYPIMVDAEIKEKSMLNWVEDMRVKHFQNRFKSHKDNENVEAMDSSGENDSERDPIKTGEEINAPCKQTDGETGTAKIQEITGPSESNESKPDGNVTEEIAASSRQTDSEQENITTQTEQHKCEKSVA